MDDFMGGGSGGKRILILDKGIVVFTIRPERSPAIRGRVTDDASVWKDAGAGGGSLSRRGRRVCMQACELSLSKIT
jgi:hypothetical protein